MRDGIGRARLDAIAAEDATRIINVVKRLRSAHRRRYAVRRVFRSLDVDAASRASRRTQKSSPRTFPARFRPDAERESAIASLEVGQALRDNSQ